MSASYYAVYQIWTRRLTLVDSPETLIVYTAAAGALVTTVTIPWLARWPDSLGDFLAFAGLGLVGALAHLCIVQALKRAPASTVSPIGYFELVTAVPLRLRGVRRPPRRRDLGGRRPHRRLGRLDRVPQPRPCPTPGPSPRPHARQGQVMLIPR